jgi:ribosomal protein S6E (S10)
MFIQIIQGKCTRQDELRALADSWRQEVSPPDSGFLGGTYGFTDDGQFVGVVRFENRDKAMANSKRPEQSQWAEQMQALFDGPIEYHDCDDVTLMLEGGSDQAGFVQVIRGKVDDPARIKSMLTSNVDMMHRERPEILGATLAIEPDGTFTETVAFTDEASARQGERKQPPEDMLQDWETVMRNAKFMDLRHPWFESA